MHEPAWLIAQVDQRLALVKHVMKQAALSDELQPTVVMLQLREPEPMASELERQRWDRSCDHCSKYCPSDFYTGSTTRAINSRQRLVVTYGVCPECAKGFGS